MPAELVTEIAHEMGNLAVLEQAVTTVVKGSDVTPDEMPQALRQAIDIEVQQQSSQPELITLTAIGASGRYAAILMSLAEKSVNVALDRYAESVAQRHSALEQEFQTTHESIAQLIEASQRLEQQRASLHATLRNGRARAYLASASRDVADNHFSAFAGQERATQGIALGRLLAKNSDILTQIGELRGALRRQSEELARAQQAAVEVPRIRFDVQPVPGSLASQARSGFVWTLAASVAAISGIWTARRLDPSREVVLGANQLERVLGLPVVSAEINFCS